MAEDDAANPFAKPSSQPRLPSAAGEDDAPLGLERVRVLGSGSFGCAVLMRSPSGTFLVAKEMPAEQENEVAVLRKLRHPAIIGFVDVARTRAGITILLEYADGGDLEGALNARRESHGAPLEEDRVLRLFAQVLCALAYLHERSVLHRDLKPRNILIVGEDSVRLADFGVAKETDDMLALSRVGTPYYMAPEILHGRPYGPAADLWSAGVVLFEVATLERPFEAQSFPALAIKVLHAEVPVPQPPRVASICAVLLRKARRSSQPVLQQLKVETKKKYCVPASERFESEYSPKISG
jgi:NIMA (never in mitosis gene a)-related kinase